MISKSGGQVVRYMHYLNWYHVIPHPKEHILSRHPSHFNPLECSQQALDWIMSDTLSADAMAALNHETLNAFREYVNPGFLEYRKSVTSGGSYGAVEWRASGLTRCLIRKAMNTSTVLAAMAFSTSVTVILPWWRRWKNNCQTTTAQPGVAGPAARHAGENAGGHYARQAEVQLL